MCLWGLSHGIFCASNLWRSEIFLRARTLGALNGMLIRTFIFMNYDASYIVDVFLLYSLFWQAQSPNSLRGPFTLLFDLVLSTDGTRINNKVWSGMNIPICQWHQWIFVLVLWANSGDYIQRWTLHRTKRERICYTIMRGYIYFIKLFKTFKKVFNKVLWFSEIYCRVIHEMGFLMIGLIIVSDKTDSIPGNPCNLPLLVTLPEDTACSAPQGWREHYIWAQCF